MSRCTKKQRKLCQHSSCLICSERKFEYFDGLTQKGKRKVDCWDYDKNGDIKPKEVTKKSAKKYWFKCDICDHSFFSQISSITSKKLIWCPYCSVQKICDNDECKHCFNNSFSSYQGLTLTGKKKIDCWDYEKNGDIKPRNISKKSGKKYYFICDICYHSFSSMIYDITRKDMKRGQIWCPYCCIPSKKICKSEECEFCFTKSFSSYKGLTLKGKKKVDCWDYEKNEDIKPRNITIGTDLKYNFICDVCDHSFSTSPNSITSKNSGWCPYCCIPSKKLCKSEECEFCFTKSFSSYKGLTLKGKKKVDCWDYEKNGDIKPRGISIKTHSKYWFKCDVCVHYFYSVVKNIASKKPSWCPYCSIQTRKLCEYDECKFCFNNSFSSYKGLTFNGKKKVDCWDYDKNGDIKPRDIAKSCNSKYWFKCDICEHSFCSAISNITLNRWCSYCKNKTESKFKYWFHKQYPTLKLKHQPRYNWCKNFETNRHRPFDFVVEETKIIFEIDGEQHFTQVSNWISPDKQLEIDKFKMKVAIKEGYSIIRILQDDIWFDKNQWKEKFIKAFISYDDPTIICIGCDIKYKKYL